MLTTCQHPCFPLNYVYPILFSCSQAVSALFLNNHLLLILIHLDSGKSVAISPLFARLLAVKSGPVLSWLLGICSPWWITSPSLCSGGGAWSYLNLTWQSLFSLRPVPFWMENKEADLDGEKSRWSREEKSSGLEGEERKDNKGKKYLNKS